MNIELPILTLSCLFFNAFLDYNLSQTYFKSFPKSQSQLFQSTLITTSNFIKSTSQPDVKTSSIITTTPSITLSHALDDSYSNLVEMKNEESAVEKENLIENEAPTVENQQLVKNETFFETDLVETAIVVADANIPAVTVKPESPSIQKNEIKVNEEDKPKVKKVLKTNLNIKATSVTIKPQKPNIITKKPTQSNPSQKTFVLDNQTLKTDPKHEYQ